MRELSLDSVRLPTFDRDAAVVVVTFGAPRFRVALSADARLPSSGDAVSAEPTGVVPHEAFGHESAEILRPMTRRALGAFELCLVAGQADTHRRCAGCLARRIEYAGVTAVALAADGGKREVGAVREEDLPPACGNEARDLHGTSELLLSVLVAPGACARLRWWNLSDLLRAGVTTGARQARGLSGAAACQLQVPQVREPGQRRTVAGCETAGQDQARQEQHRAEPARTVWPDRALPRGYHPRYHRTCPTVSSS
jgi:hypothetical protein